MLLVEDNPLDAHLVRAMLSTCGLASDLTVVESFAEARSRLEERSFDIVLLDLFLPDTRGLDTLRHLRVVAPETAIVVLTGSDERGVAIRAVRDGAQDYLAKDGLDGEALSRAVRYGIERNRLLTEIRSMSLRDELTALYNRRGLFTMAEQQVRVAMRTGRGISIFFIDLDGMKAINDRLGHREGDRALRETADLLRNGFRNSDIVARIGGDEFVVLALETDGQGTDVILDRLDTALARLNAEDGRTFTLAMSTGVVVYDPAAPVPLDELLTRADAAMYERKRAKPRVPRGAPEPTTPGPSHG